MDGRPWMEIFDGAEPVDRIPSWEEVEGEAGMHPEEVREDPSEVGRSDQTPRRFGLYRAPQRRCGRGRSKNCMLDQRNNLVQALTASRRAAKAIPLLQELAADYPDQALLQSSLATVYSSLGKYDECEETISRLPPEFLRQSKSNHCSHGSLTLEGTTGGLPGGQGDSRIGFVRHCHGQSNGPFLD